MPFIHSIKEHIQSSYQGLIPTRKDGKQRRQLILQATCKIIADQGIQGVKHRAVAQEASVPLAATTYYFNDIRCLLNDAFLFFCESTLNDLETLDNAGKTVLTAIEESKAVDQASSIKETLVAALLQHIENQISDKDSRIIERAFRTEALRDSEIAALVLSIENSQLLAIQKFLQAVGSSDPESDARELLALILFMEHRLLAGFVSKKQVSNSLTRFVERLL